MEININISNKMSVEKQKLLEDRVIRIPKSYREKFGVTVGEFIHLRTNNGELLVLQVEIAYKEDNKADEMSAYVTDTIYAKLNIINNKNDDIKIIDEITLGTDPEFFLINTVSKDILSATRFFDKWGTIGYDGVLAEIRPDPSTSEEVLTENIRTLLNKAKQIIDQNKTLSTSMIASSHYKGLCSGFHLHYGIPKQLLNNYSSNKPILNTIIRILDFYVALPAVIVEGIKDSGRRCAPFIAYGKIGDYRVDHRTLEYRVPGASLLKHPILAKGLIALGATVIEDVISRARVLTDNFSNKDLLGQHNINSLYPGIPDTNTLYRSVCVPDTTNARLYLDSIITDVRNMIGYNKRAASIEAFFSNLDTPFSNNLISNWQLGYKKMTA